MERNGRAIDASCLLYSRLRYFHSVVRKAVETIERAMQETTAWSVSFSGGKDSTVLLHLCRQVDPSLPAVFFDSGAEYPETYDFVTATENVVTVQAGMDLLQMYRTTGMFGHEAERPDSHWRKGQIKRTMINDPATWANENFGFEGNFTGIRAEESAARKKMARAKPKIWLSVNSTWRCEPLIDWKHLDVWAYIAKHDLPYNAAYDKLAALGVPREHWRVAPFAGASAIGFGRWAILKKGWPELFDQFAAEFPEVRCYV